MNDRELLELIAAKVANLDTKVGSLDTKVGSLASEVSGLKDGQKRIEITLEHDISPKIQALFDGYKQYTDQLERIEKEVSRHDEFIIKKIK
jgi:hypothetical protein